MSWSLVAKTGLKSTSYGSSKWTTSPGVDTTGATLLVIVLYSPNSPPAGTPSDSYGNTWAFAEVFNHVSGGIYYVANPTVGAGHTFSAGGSGNNSYNFTVLAYSGAATSSPLDQKNNNYTNAATSLSTGSITPSQNGCLIVAGYASGTLNLTLSINDSFTLEDTETGGYAGTECAADLIQTTAAAIDPTWTVTAGTPSGYVSGVIASFLPASGASGQIIPFPWSFRAGGMQEMTAGMRN